MQIEKLELDWLNFYRASELHGGLILGKMVTRVRDPRLVLELTRHSAEEVAHAQLWTETIMAVGGKPAPVRNTYQSHYARVIGTPASVLQVLALTQIFERRVYRHFLAHERRPGTHPLVRATLRRMVEEEKHHLSWVKEWLDQESQRDRGRVSSLLRQYALVDAQIYDQLCTELKFKQAA